MALGKFFLLPVMGLTLFGYLTYVLKNMHNFAGPLFTVSLVIVLAVFLRDNLPRKGDLHWLLRMGGVFGRGHELVPSHRFNAGEKAVFWIGNLLLGVIVISSGLVLDKLIPGLVYERGTMQIANMIHGVSSALMMAMLLLHIYLGTVGVRGAYRGMREGYVTDEWVQEHHAYWYDDVRSGKIPVQRSKPLLIVDETAGQVRPA